MRRLFFIIWIVLLFPFLSAIDIQMDSSVSRGETVIASVSGNFLDPVTDNDVKFYRGHVETSFIYDVGKIGDDYYIAFQTLGKSSQNYSVRIEGVRYYVGSQVSNEDIVKNFTVNSEQADFKIDPGFVLAEEDFSISVQNLNSDSIIIEIQSQTVSGSGGFFDFLFNNEEVDPSEDTVQLLSGDIEDIYVNVDSLEGTTIRTLTLSTSVTSYDIPVYVSIPESPEDSEVEGNETNSTSEDQNETEIINETENEEDNDSVIVNETKNETEDEGSFWDLFKGENDTDAEEDSNENYDVVEDEDGNAVAVDDGGNVIEGPASSLTCSQLNGSVCSSGEICSNSDSVYAKDSVCCITSCVKVETNNNKRIVAFFIIGIIIVFLILFKIKYNKTKKKKVDLLKIPRKKF